MNLLMLGEAAKHLAPSTCSLEPQIDWKPIAGMRDLIAHKCFALNDQIIWDAATNFVADLGDAAHRIRDRIEGP